MWKSKMQKTTALSTAEAEYYSVSTAGSEVLYLRKLLERMGFAHWQTSPTPVYKDNTACIEWGKNVIEGRERAKHLYIRKPFAHEVIQNGEMLLVSVPTDGADIFSPNSQISSSPRASTDCSGRHASKASSAGRSNLLKGPPTSKGVDRRKFRRSPGLKSRVTSALKRCVAT